VSANDLEVTWKQLKPRENTRREVEVQIGRLDSGGWPARGECAHDKHVFCSYVWSHHVSVCVCIFSYISARLFSVWVCMCVEVWLTPENSQSSHLYCPELSEENSSAIWQLSCSMSSCSSVLACSSLFLGRHREIGICDFNLQGLHLVSKSDHTPRCCVLRVVFFTMGDQSSWSGGAGSGSHGDHGRYAYPQLTSTNYTSWSIRVQAIMEKQGVWEVVEPPEGVSSAQSEDRAHLLQCLPDDLLM
jgi:hypothetical protein